MNLRKEKMFFMFILLALILLFSCNNFLNQGLDNFNIKNTTKSLVIKIDYPTSENSGIDSRSLASTDYIIKSLKIVVTKLQSGEIVGDFIWLPSESSNFYYVNTENDTQYKISVTHTAEKDGQTVSAEESIIVTIKPMVITTVSIVPGDICLINVDTKTSNDDTNTSAQLVYYNKLENLNSWLLPDIKAPWMNPYIDSVNGGEELAVPGMFGNCSYFRFTDSESQTGYNQSKIIYLNDTTVDLPEKGTLEFWMKMGESCPGAVIDTRCYISIGGLGFSIQQYQGVHKTDGLYISCLSPGNSDIIVYENLDQVGKWKYYYMTWDSNKNLGSENYSVRYWVDGVNVTNVESCNYSSHDYWKVYYPSCWLYSTANKICIDNIKIWDNVVSDNSTDINARYNNGLGIE